MRRYVSNSDLAFISPPAPVPTRRYNPIVVDSDSSDDDDLPLRPWPLPTLTLPPSSNPSTPPTLLSRVTDLFLPGTPSPHPSPGLSIPTDLPTGPSVPNIPSPGGSASSSSDWFTQVDNGNGTMYVPSGSHYSTHGSNYGWQSTSSAGASGSTSNGAFFNLASRRAEEAGEYLDPWADDYTVANSDDLPI